jgi:O-antigen/teichoic acid export membrane protein
MADFFEKPSVERLVAGGTYIVGFSVLAGLLGWLVILIASRSDIGVGPSGLGFFATANAFNYIMLSISGGFNQSLSKYISEALVDSKEKALVYVKSGFFVFNLIGIALFCGFFAIFIIIFPNNYSYALIFGVLAITYYLTFMASFFMGNLAAVHRFDRLGIAAFATAIGSAGAAFAILFLVPSPLNAILLPLMLIAGLLTRVIFTFYFARKSVPYTFSSIFHGVRRREAIQIIKYGAYSTVPNIIYSAAILWIQTLWFSGLLGIGTPVVSANGIIIGYASVALAICQMGWPQIPAISEAKAMNDYDLIDDYMKTTLHNGFNMSIFLLTVYIGISYIILNLLHGPEYLFAHVPFIILSIGVAIIGVEFLICTLLVGLGEGKKAAILILSLTLIQIVLTPLLILYFNTNFGLEPSLYAGPISLLISSIAILPIAFRYMVKYTKNRPSVYTNILWKAMLSMILSLGCWGLFEWLVFPHSPLVLDMVIGLFLRAVILFGFFLLFMLIFAGLNDADLDIYNKYLGPLRFMIRGFRWLLHCSPFYEKEQENSEPF